MSLFNTNKDKDKKKGKQTTTKSGFAPQKSGKSNPKSAARNTRLTGRAQRGS
jgi:hypothetical protein